MINHYTDGIPSGEVIAKELKKGVQLNSKEKTDLIAFLLTLNDSTFVFNPENKFPKHILLSREGK